MGERARLRPHRGPQDERPPAAPAPMYAAGRIAPPANGAITASYRRPSASAAAGREPPRGERRRGELRVEIAEPGGHVALAAAEAQHLDAVALGQPRVQRHPVAGEVRRHQRDRHAPQATSGRPGAALCWGDEANEHDLCGSGSCGGDRPLRRLQPLQQLQQFHRADRFEAPPRRRRARLRPRPRRGRPRRRPALAGHDLQASDDDAAAHDHDHDHELRFGVGPGWRPPAAAGRRRSAWDQGQQARRRVGRRPRPGHVHDLSKRFGQPADGLAPAFLAISLTVVSGDGKPHQVRLLTLAPHVLHVPAGGRATTLIGGLKAGDYASRSTASRAPSSSSAASPGPRSRRSASPPWRCDRAAAAPRRARDRARPAPAPRSGPGRSGAVGSSPPRPPATPRAPPASSG